MWEVKADLVPFGCYSARTKEVLRTKLIFHFRRIVHRFFDFELSAVAVTRQPQKFLVGLLHITCQTPTVIAWWSLSGKHQHGWLGVIILLRLRCRKKYIFLVFSERKFWKVKRTFLTPSRQPLSRFSWNLASFLSDSFSRKPRGRILFYFSVFE